jgi:hypothetical protein
MPIRQSGLGPTLVVTALAGVAGLCGVLLLPAGFFSGDEGIKLLEGQALLASGWKSRALAYPGGILDPTHVHFPLRPPFAWVHGTSWYGLYPIPFPALTALGFAAFGLRGLFLVPWACATLSVLLCGILATRALGSPSAGAAVALAAAVTTPLLLYGTLHWEHTAAVALTLGVLVLLSAPEPRLWRLITAGVLVGLGPTVRTELYCLPVAVVAFVLFCWGARLRTLWRLAIIGAAALVPAGLFWVWNQWSFGTWDPVVEIDRRLVIRRHQSDSMALFFPRRAAPWLGQKPWALLVLATAIGLVPERNRVLCWLRALGGALVCIWAATLAYHALSLGKVGVDRTIIGLFAATPLALLGLLRGPCPSGDPRRIGPACIAAAIALSVTMYLCDLEAHTGGLQLGSRYLLPAAPLFLVGAADLIRLRPRTAGPAAALLGAISIAATVVNLRAEIGLRRSNADLLAAVTQTDCPFVVTNFFWVPQVLAPIYPERKIFWAGFDGGDHVLGDLYGRGVRCVVRAEGGIRPHRGPVVEAAPQRVVLPPERVVVYRLESSGEP